MAERLGDRLVIATAQTNLGNVAIGEQRLRRDVRAVRHRRAAVRTSSTSRRVLVPLLANRGQVNQAMNRPQEAAADFDGAAKRGRPVGPPPRGQAVGRHGRAARRTSSATSAAPSGCGDRLAAGARATGDDAGLQLAVGEHALLLINRSQSTGPASVDRERRRPERCSTRRRPCSTSRRRSVDGPATTSGWRAVSGTRRSCCATEVTSPVRSAASTSSYDLPTRSANAQGAAVRDGQSRRGAGPARSDRRGDRRARRCTPDGHPVRHDADGAAARQMIAALRSDVG